MYKIRIYTRAGNQIDLWVKDFVITPNFEGTNYTKWEGSWNIGDPHILSILPGQIEAVVVLEEKADKVPTDLGQQKR